MAAFLAPLALLPLLTHAQLAFALTLAAVALFLAWKSPAYPLGLAALPVAVVAVLGSNPFPKGALAFAIFAWMAAAIAFAMLRGEDALPAKILMTMPVVCSFALALLMLGRLAPSPAEAYGVLKLKLFLTGNVALLLGGILVGRRRKDFTLFLVLSLAMAAVMAALLVRDLLSGHAPTLLADRYSLPELNPIFLGRGSATGLIVAVYVVLTVAHRWLSRFALGVVPLVAVALIASGSRGPVVGLVLGLAVLLTLLLRERSARRRFLLLIGGSFLAVALVRELVPGHSVGRSLSILLSGASGISTTGRNELWSLAYHTFRDNPLVGMGTGGFAAIAPGGELYPHNLLLEVAVELGVIGLLLVVGILFIGALTVARIWRDSRGRNRSDSALVLALFVSALMNALVSGDIQANSAVWLALGLGLGLSLRPAAANKRRARAILEVQPRAARVGRSGA